MIRVANLLSPDLDAVADALAALLRTACAEPVRFEAGAGPADFRDGRIGIALICGLAYNNACDITTVQLTALLSRMPARGLRQAGITRWQAVDDAYYEPIRAAVRELPGLDAAAFN